MSTQQINDLFDKYAGEYSTATRNYSMKRDEFASAVSELTDEITRLTTALKIIKEETIHINEVREFLFISADIDSVMSLRTNKIEPQFVYDTLTAVIFDSRRLCTFNNCYKKNNSIKIYHIIGEVDEINRVNYFNLQGDKNYHGIVPTSMIFDREQAVQESLRLNDLLRSYKEDSSYNIYADEVAEAAAILSDAPAQIDFTDSELNKKFYDRITLQPVIHAPRKLKSVIPISPPKWTFTL